MSWLGQDKAMAIYEQLLLFQPLMIRNHPLQQELLTTVVCNLSVFLQCSGQVHSCSQLLDVPPLSPPFSTLAHQTALHHSSSLASMWSHLTNTLHNHHGYLSESDPVVQGQFGTLYQWPSILQQVASSLLVHPRGLFPLLETIVK